MDVGTSESTDVDSDVCYYLSSYLPHFLLEYCPHVDEAFDMAMEYVDLDYLSWLFWLFWPVIIAFLLPLLLILFLYTSAIFLHVYGLRNRLKEAFKEDLWSGARTTIASFWDAHGRIWHGYSVIGMENIPDEGSALIVYYHGTVPVDVYYLICKCILYKERTLNCVADKFVFKIPGWKKLCDVFCITPGTRESCIATLVSGNLLCISPGGVREAMFSRNYSLVWEERTGFAEVAIKANTIVLPMFTENCREPFVFFPFFKDFFRKIYESTRLPLLPIFGWFPVKLRTYIGEPILPELLMGKTPAQVRDIVKTEVEGLIKKHQTLPGSVLRGIWQRFRSS